MTSAKEYTFGCEIELTLPNEVVNRHGLRIGAYHNGIQVPFLPRGWKAERDGSIQASSGYQACEIVSPVLKGEEGIKEVIEVLKKLNELKFAVNESTGAWTA